MSYIKDIADTEDEDRAYERLRQERDDDLVRMLEDIARSHELEFQHHWAAQQDQDDQFTGEDNA